MKIIVFGLGYVGLTAAACSLKDGHIVHGIDVSSAKVQELSRGRSPVFEPGLEELLEEGIEREAFSVSTDLPENICKFDLALVCVGTPSLPDGSHNMSYIANVSRDIAKSIKSSAPSSSPLTIAYRSTVRPGTMEELATPIINGVLGTKSRAYELVYNPEFLRESTAISDYFAPPKIVVGTHNGEPNATMDQLYASIDATRFNVHFREAEITKFVDNSFHATKVAFANEIGRICHRLGISASTVHEIFVSDRKLNISPYYLRPGGAFGGSCLPKDVRALIHIASDVGANTHLIDSLLRTNTDHKRYLFEEAREGLQPNSNVLIVGVAFKAKSDDLRESPLLEIAELFRRDGHKLDIYDPYVRAEVLHGANLGYQLAHIPSLGDMLISEKELSGRHYDLVIDGRDQVGELDITYSKSYNVQTMS
jgi:GDP-mannose 6-dehydrogenase